MLYYLDMVKKGLEELQQFHLTRAEYAKRLGISPNAVRMRMRHGKLSGEYRFDGSKYIFKAPEEPREKHVQTTSHLTAPNRIKRKINRGNHFKADYPNDAFRLYNEEKKRVAALNKIQGKFKSKAHEIEFNRLNQSALNEAYKRSKRNTELDEKNSFTPLKDYGGPIRLRPRDRSLVIDEPIREPRLQRNYQYYEIGEPVDDGSVMIDLSRSETESHEPSFSNKVQESIWRLKNKK